MSEPKRLADAPIHLGLGATARALGPITGFEWFAAYEAATAADGADGRLVASYVFDTDWDSWEMHPAGAEVVLCLAGAVTLHQEHADGSTATVALTAGEYAINPPGRWHTADVAERCTAVFITAGRGTEHRPR